MNLHDRQKIKENRNILKNTIELDTIKEHLETSKIFTRCMLDDLYAAKTDLYEELPTRGPEAFIKFVRILKKAKYFTVAEKLLAGCDAESAEKMQQISKLEENTFGQCLIINNTVFLSKNVETRSNVEAFALEKVFREKSRSVRLINNEKRDSMTSVLKNFSKKDFTDVDFCLVIILSYGDKIQNHNILYGTDSEYIYEAHILRLFNNTNCPSLSRKLKIFLLPSSDFCVCDACKQVIITFTIFEDMCLIRWPHCDIGDKCFGEELAECFSKYFNRDCDIMDLKKIVTLAYEAFKKNCELHSIKVKIQFS